MEAGSAGRARRRADSGPSSGARPRPGRRPRGAGSTAAPPRSAGRSCPGHGRAGDGSRAGPESSSRRRISASAAPRPGPASTASGRIDELRIPARSGRPATDSGGARAGAAPRRPARGRSPRRATATRHWIIAVRPSTSGRSAGMSQMRTSIVPFSALGRTSHHSSRATRRSPPPPSDPARSRNSDQEVQRRHHAPGREPFQHVDPVCLVAGRPPLPERAVGRHRQQDRQHTPGSGGRSGWPCPPTRPRRARAARR